MATSTETRKDIFRLTSQGQLELPELTAKTSLNTIEFRANDGIYVNGVLLAPGGGGPPGNTTTADYSPTTPPPLITVPTVPFGRTLVAFNAPSFFFDHVDGTGIEIPYTENPAKPFSTISKIVPIIRQTNGKANHLMGAEFSTYFVFDSIAGTFVLTIYFGSLSGTGGKLEDFSLEIDFLVA
jgi:hypothetical protein